MGRGAIYVDSRAHSNTHIGIAKTRDSGLDVALLSNWTNAAPV